MKFSKTVCYLLLAGGLGGLTNSIVVWSFGALGITSALGFGIGTPIWTLFFAAIWGITGTLFLSGFGQKDGK